MVGGGRGHGLLIALCIWKCLGAWQLGDGVPAFDSLFCVLTCDSLAPHSVPGTRWAPEGGM